MSEAKIWKRLGFKTKTSLETQIQNIVKAYENDESISEEHKKFMMLIFENHPEWHLKRGVGIEKIRIDQARITHGKNTRCFYIDYVDGKTDDISWKACLNPPTRLQDFASACRFEIAAQITLFRNTIKNGELCKECSAPLILKKTEIDHVSPKTHKWLVEEFIRLSKVDVNSVVTIDAGDQTLFEDRELATNWSNFHKENANLRFLCKSCHSSKKSYIVAHRRSEFSQI